MKRFLISLLIIAMKLSLVSCGKTTTDKNGTATTAQQGQTQPLVTDKGGVFAPRGSCIKNGVYYNKSTRERDFVNEVAVFNS